MMVWERGIPSRSGKGETKRGLKIGSGVQCQSIDRVTFISQADFDDFVKMKEAYCLRLVLVHWGLLCL